MKSDEELFKEIIYNTFKTYKVKNAAYGDAWKKHEMWGLLVRVSDKIERVLNLWKQGKLEENQESIFDNWHDVGVYSVLAQIWLVKYGKKEEGRTE